ncbi:MAG: hypothetical protein ACI4XF_12205 [Oscillospiraceae bacterium]
MKTLAEIQKDLEEVIQKVKTISADIAEIEEASRAKDSDISVDMEMVKANAKSRLYVGHALENQDEGIKRKYLTLLFSAIFGTNTEIEDALAYVYKVGYSAGYTGDMKELYSKGLNMTSAELSDTLSGIRGTKLAEVLMVDMLILTENYLSDKETTRQYTAKMFSLLGLDSEQVEYIIAFAKMIITENIEEFEDVDTDKEFIDDEYDCFINYSPVIRKAVEEERRVLYMHLRPILPTFLYNSSWIVPDNISNFEELYFSVRLISYIDHDKDNNIIKLDIQSENTPRENHYSIRLYGYNYTHSKADVKQSAQFRYIFSYEDDIYNYLEVTNEITPSWTPAVGYYHSSLDTKKSADEWFKKQPQIDPKYDSLSLVKIREIGEKEEWNSNYTTEVLSKV